MKELALSPFVVDDVEELSRVIVVREQQVDRADVAAERLDRLRGEVAIVVVQHRPATRFDVKHVVDAGCRIAADHGLLTQAHGFALTDGPYVAKAEAGETLDHGEVGGEVCQHHHVRIQLCQPR